MLLRRPKPFEDESIRSYIYRITQENYCTENDLKKLLSLSNENNLIRSLTYNKDSKIRNNFAELLGLSPKEIENFIHDFGYFEERDTYLKICPICLKESFYERYYWKSYFISTCPYHGIKLIENCSNCGMRIKANNFFKKFCTCGLAYDSFERRTASKLHLEFDNLILYSLGSNYNSSNNNSIPQLSPALYKELTEDLYYFESHNSFFHFYLPMLNYYDFEINESFSAHNFFNWFVIKWPYNLIKYIHFSENSRFKAMISYPMHDFNIVKHKYPAKRFLTRFISNFPFKEYNNSLVYLAIYFYYFDSMKAFLYKYYPHFILKNKYIHRKHYIDIFFNLDMDDDSYTYSIYSPYKIINPEMKCDLEFKKFCTNLDKYSYGLFIDIDKLIKYKKARINGYLMKTYNLDISMKYNFDYFHI